MSGRFGSGRRRDPARAKPVVEDCPFIIDILELYRAGVLNSDSTGELSYESSTVAYRVHRTKRPVLELAFIVADGEVSSERHQVVRLVTTVPPLGGLRWWFICPGCGRKVIKLYMPQGAPALACSKCHRLTWRSNQREDKRVYRLRRQPKHVIAILRGEVEVGLTEWYLAIRAAALIGPSVPTQNVP